MLYTPGPWIKEPRMRTAVNAGVKHVAMVNWCCYKEYEITGDEHEGNVALIESAPELFEALRDLLEQAKAHIAYPCQEIQQAEAVISKVYASAGEHDDCERT